MWYFDQSVYTFKYLSLPPFSKGNTQCIYIDFMGDVWWMRNALKCFEYQTQNFTVCRALFWKKTSRSIPTSIYTTVLMLQLVGFKRLQPCMNGMAILNDRVRKICVHFSLMVVKPPGYNGDAVRISFPSAPLSRTCRAGASTWNCISSPSTETAAEGRAEGSNSRRNSRCCSCTRTRTKPKAGTDTNCHLNAQEQDKQLIELQKQQPDLPEQAPPHESVPAALQQKHQQKEQQMLLILQGPNETQSKNRHQLHF